MATSELCSCFGKLQTKYKRKVNQIFPRDARDGLIKSNMDKLIFYALSSPEKLDRIGAYLAKKLERHIYWKRYDFVVIAMEAMEQLLSACHAPDINLFVESFLKMVQRLLESTETNLQIRGTASFVIFANIEEDTPSYHREYDFFVSKFSQMCYRDGSHTEESNQVVTAGLKGLQGIFRKTVSDDLQVNIWDKQFMGKIIPSLLYVMEQRQPKSSQAEHSEPVNSEDEPCNLAELILREIISRATFGNVHSAIEPVLLHFDSAELWVPSEFAVHCFRIILFSVKNQYSYLVIQILLNHLNKHAKSHPAIKTVIVEVISSSVAIASGESMGASVIEVFNTLLRHLRLSIDLRNNESDANNTEAFEEAIIKAIGVFAQFLPDYQKTEIMMFIMGKLPNLANNLSTNQSIEGDDEDDNMQDETLQEMYLLCLLKVALVYKTEKFSVTFPDTLLDSLLKVSISRNSKVRRLGHEIFHTLIDRHNNLSKLTITNTLKGLEETGIVIQKSTNDDIVFFQKRKDKLFWHIYQSASHTSNTPDNIFVIYQTLVLICIEINNDSSILIELIRFVLSLQLIDREQTMTRTKAATHAAICACLHFIADFAGIEQLQRYVMACIKSRENYKYLLPTTAFSDHNLSVAGTGLVDGLFFSLEAVKRALQDSELDTVILMSPYVPQPFPDPMVSSLQDEKSHSLRSEIESLSSTGAAQFIITEEITFDALKEILHKRESQSVEAGMDMDKATFNDFAAIADGRAHEFNMKIDDVLEISDCFSETNNLLETPSLSSFPGEENYEMRFSDQYVY